MTRVMVVEDEADSLEALGSWFADRGYEVLAVRSGAAALEKADAHLHVRRFVFEPEHTQERLPRGERRAHGTGGQGVGVKSRTISMTRSKLLDLSRK